MADSDTTLPTISASVAQPTVQANALLLAASSVMMFARHPVTTAALTWGYLGGRLSGTQFPDGTVALTASTTNYVVAHRTTLAVTAATTTTNWNNTGTYGRMYLITTGTAAVTAYEDHRYGTDGILALGAPGGGGIVSSVAASGGAETVSGSPITSTGTIRGAELVNNQTGTSDTVADGDRGALLTYSNAASIAVTLPQAGAGSAFLVGWYADFQNRGAGVVTITPTTSTIDGAATLTLTQHEGARLVSDGTNYFTARGRLTLLPVVIQIACSDETTALSTGVAKATFRMPFAMTLTGVRASLTTVSSSGTPTVDINEAGVTILSTKLTIDASEKTSTTAAIPPVISDAALADDAEITIDIDTAGTGAAGLKVAMLGYRTL